ncbi:hypothetical protein KFK09_001875 [Dendrobium nobile]|uniref:SAM-dependent methyltransferase Erg6/SMT-type domain-containing protein n=1 Tax=Dendrobium nobile TaxID=94219 RepID=A0A8T3C8Q0_DENNO|nr:hypothetical protein KFK09_001875 [Dendrobium nobile]
MKMPFPDNTFDAIYAIEATCHAPDSLGCFKEIKAGQCFAAYEWCMTDNYDPNNEIHKKIKAEIEIGDGLPDIKYRWNIEMPTIVAKSISILLDA